MENEIRTIQQELDTAIVQIQRERERETLARRERQLLSYAAQQGNHIPVVMGEALLESTNVLFASNKLHTSVRKRSIARRGEIIEFNHDVVVVGDGDIESNEERLQAELG